jgi:ELWxxDGT repeat protein
MRIRPARPFAFLGLLLAALPALGQAPAFLVRDINPSHPAPIVNATGAESEGVGSFFYFVSNDGTHGSEIWRTDGTPAGTFLLKDICPGACSPFPRVLTGSNGLLFFFADDPEKGPGLWKSDGTPEGTSLVKGGLDGLQGLGGFLGPAMVDAGGKLLFTVMSSGGFVEIWVTDGTLAGTHGIGSAAQGFYSVPRFLAAGGGRVLFAADQGLRLEPWVTDGTNAGTHAVADVNPGVGASLSLYDTGPGNDAVAAPWGGFVFVADDGAHGPEVWATDGTATGASLVKDITPGFSGSAPYGFTAVNGKVVFGAADPSNGSELWATDGTPAGTVLLRDIRSGSLGSAVRGFTVVGSQAFFRADDLTHGAELWATDGTAGGTRLVKDLVPGEGGGFPSTDGTFAFSSLGGRLVFQTFGPDLPFNPVWTSDGTDAGTQPLPPPSGSWPFLDIYSVDRDWYGVAGGRLFFPGELYDPSVWVTDGTTAGSSKILDLPVSTSSFLVSSGTMEPRLLADLGGTLVFQATDGQFIHDYALWRSDGTGAGTSVLKDSNVDYRYVSLPHELHAVNGRLAFHDLDRLGLSDGTEAGTVLVPGSSVLAFATRPLGSDLFFLSQPDSGDAGLWKTDGTEAGTVLVAAQSPLTPGGSPVPSGGKVFYSLYNGFGFDLWASDGTAAGTSMLKPSLNPAGMVDAGGTLFFQGFQAEIFRYTLWKSDGTATGTVHVSTVAATGPLAALPGGTVLFLGNDGAQGEELWRSDGTDAGTVLVKDIAPGLAGSRISGLIVAGNQAFFAASDGVHGLELWVSDGTTAGTRLVKDIVPGAGSSVPSSLTAVGSVAVFSAFDEAGGVEAWRSDGTDAGTWRLADIAPGPLSSSPLGFTLSGNKLFFTADDNTTGFELWAIPKIWVTGTFADVPPNYWAWSFVESLAASGVTGGCGAGNFCPGDLVNRAQMAVFLLSARGGTVPPPATGSRFNDVPAGYWAGPWIEQLANEGVVGGCSVTPPLYCPENHLTRAEMAVLLTSARHETPPAATGTRFGDVPADYWAAPWIEQLAADGITGGCGGGNFCPDQPVTRAEMAVFLSTAFHLPLP